jgi:hypothetical protein
VSHEGAQAARRDGSLLKSAEKRLDNLGINLPAPPSRLACMQKLQTGNLLFLTGMPPTGGQSAKFIGRVGAELDLETG